MVKPSTPATAPAGTAKPAETPAATPAAPATPAKPKRPARAEHDWINATGDVVDDLELATGIKYRDLSVGENAPNASFSYQIPNATVGEVKTMFAVWGARTKAINTASAARQKRKADATFTLTDVEHMTAVFAEVKDGQWEAPSEGGAKKRGPAWDLDLLCTVIVEALNAQGAKNVDATKIRAKLGDDVAYRNGATKQPQFMAEYWKRKGAPPAGVDSFNV